MLCGSADGEEDREHWSVETYESLRQNGELGEDISVREGRVRFESGMDEFRGLPLQKK